MKGRSLPVWRRFIPALIVWPLWIYVMTIRDVWDAAYSQYWPMAFSMIFGSFIAGSTPLGGAVVAFPVAVLVIQFNPGQGRDFAALIQAVGMTAAAFLILTSKLHLVHVNVIVTSCLTGTLGVITGLCIEVTGLFVLCTYTTYVLAFAATYRYINYMKQFEPPAAVIEENAADRVIAGAEALVDDCKRQGSELFNGGNVCPAIVGADHGEPEKLKDHVACESESDARNYENFVTVVFAVGGFLGGLITSKIGSGSDTVAYILCVLVYNPLMPDKMPESMMTASSVVIMAVITVVLALARVLGGQIDPEVFVCWGSTLPVVVAGAPLGSMMLNPYREELFRQLFYLLAIIQFITVAVLKIKTNIAAWIIISVLMSSNLLAITAHYVIRARSGPLKNISVSESSSPDASPTQTTV